MSISEFERLLQAIIPEAGRSGVTLTEYPSDQSELLRMLDRAIQIGNNRRTPLTRIDAPRDMMASVGVNYWHIPVEDCGAEGVVRLIFEAPEARQQA